MIGSSKYKSVEYPPFANEPEAMFFRRIKSKKSQVSQRFISALHSGLLNAKDTKLSVKAKSIAKRLNDNHIVGVTSIEAWLDKLDSNLGDMIFHMDVEEVLRICEAQTVSRFRRPAIRSKKINISFRLRGVATSNVFRSFSLVRRAWFSDIS